MSDHRTSLSGQDIWVYFGWPWKKEAAERGFIGQGIGRQVEGVEGWDRAGMPNANEMSLLGWHRAEL
jgi:hypothetical protein